MPWSFCAGTGGLRKVFNGRTRWWQAATETIAPTFPDVNTGAEFQVNTTASIYLSFFGPGSAAMMPENAEHLKAPLLIVSGESDPTQRSIPYVFARAPENAP